jgi:hypothetical protein
MKNLTIDDLIISNMKIIIGNISDAYELILYVDFDLENPYLVLDPFFDKVHSEMTKNQIKNINVNAKELNFINSSSIKCIVKWIVTIQKIDKNNRYTITFLTNKNALWQNLSFESLKYFAQDIIKITPI